MINKPVCLKVFDNFPHGWLNLANIPGIYTYSQKTLKFFHFFFFLKFLALGKEMADAVKIMSDWMVSVSKE